MSNLSFRMWQKEQERMLAEVKNCIEAIEKDGFTVTWNRKAMNRLQEKGYKVRYLESPGAWEVSK